MSGAKTSCAIETVGQLIGPVACTVYVPAETGVGNVNDVSNCPKSVGPLILPIASYNHTV